MAAIYNAYTREIHQELDLFAYWTPVDPPLQLGEYGEMDGKKFNRIGNIREFGSLSLRQRESTSFPIAYQSKDQVHFKTILNGSSAGSKLTVELAKKDSIFLKGEDFTVTEIENLVDVEKFLVDVYKRKGKDWRLSYVVVTKLYIPKRLLILVSQQENSAVTLTGKVSRQVTRAADVNLQELAITSVDGDVVSFQNSNGAATTPLFALHEIKDPITRKPFLTEYR